MAFSSTAAVFKFFTLLLIDLVALIGNSMILATGFRCPDLRKFNNAFIFNVAVADLCQSIFIIPFALASVYLGQWPLGPTACKVVALFKVIITLVSVQSLAGISLDRYFYIVKRKQAISSKTRLILSISVAWLNGIILGISPLLGWGELGFDDGKEICTILFYKTISHTMSVFSVGLFVPVLIMVFCYYQIFKSLHVTTKNLSRAKRINLIHETDMVSSITVEHTVETADRTKTNHGKRNRDAGNTDSASQEISVGTGRFVVKATSSGMISPGCLEVAAGNDRRSYAHEATGISAVDMPLAYDNPVIPDGLERRDGPSEEKEVHIKFVRVRSAGETKSADTYSHTLVDSSRGTLKGFTEASMADTSNKQPEEAIDSNSTRQQFQSTAMPQRFHTLDQTRRQESTRGLNTARSNKIKHLEDSNLDQRNKSQHVQSLPIPDKNSFLGRNKRQQVQSLPPTPDKNSFLGFRFKHGNMTDKELRLLRTVILVIVVFVSCWLPYVIFNILRVVSVVEDNNAMDAFNMWMAFANSAFNPLIYALSNPQFRGAIKKLLCRGKN